MARKRLQYKFNPDTLAFEVESVTFASKVKRFLLTFFAGSIIAVIWIFLYSLVLNTPKEQRLLEENREIVSSYDLLMMKMSIVNGTLDEIKDRDNKIYRAVFEEDSIPSSIREAGMGGVNRYAYIDNMGIDNSDIVIKLNMYLDKLIKKAYIQSKSFDHISQMALDKTKMQRSMPISAPLDLNKIRLTSFFGGRNHPIFGDYRFHEGVDLSGAMGMPIYASGDGVVLRAGVASGYGNLVEINHGYGYTTRYGHLSAIYVSEGAKVVRGQRIGALGNTGRSVGPHLHYEVRLKGIPRNPLNYFENSLDKESEELLEQSDDE